MRKPATPGPDPDARQDVRAGAHHNTPAPTPVLPVATESSEGWVWTAPATR